MRLFKKNIKLFSWPVLLLALFAIQGWLAETYWKNLLYDRLADWVIVILLGILVVYFVYLTSGEGKNFDKLLLTTGLLYMVFFIHLLKLLLNGFLI